MYVITGATGNVGNALARKLLEMGKPVRAISRDASRLKDLADRGAETLSGSLYDGDFLSKSFSRATAVLAMIPADVRADNMAHQQDTIGGSLTTALRVTRVPYVVNLSSIGGEVQEGTGPIAGLHRQEERLNQLQDSAVLHLRPAYFMEHFLMKIPMIKQMGIYGDAFKPDSSMPIIATRDIADYAARRLAQLDFKGKSVAYLEGQRDLTMSETIRILGASIGKPDLPYVQFSYEDAINGMNQAGLSPDVARTYVQICKAFNEGVIRAEPRSPQNTTPTSMEEFARAIFAPAFGK